MSADKTSKPLQFRFRPTPRQWLLTAAGSLATIFWYACPDFVTTAKARFFTRLGTLAGIGSLTAIVASDTVNEVRHEYTRESPDEEAWEMTSDNVNFDKKNLNLPQLILLFVLGGGFIALGIWFEFWLFRRGERRRLAGVKLAHTRQAIPLGLLFAAGYLIDDSMTN
ncbi:MAG: hypothetical protein SPK50_00875 [Mobiluncus porci]|uniref:Uncharacterized protein n=1 Tax=Mobiluncus porci TaxID=2652278 RepID=A0A7K0K2L2_9ACTO|nr:hypothetical protein [Mobiluncus porci]MDD7542365.1 hypothetical protein [Mobiluncus porci]MDY5747674.1 hypothetical protein [Mobiluncus porci]MST49644.1 hypothetical protein [Mobiluncus porci]